MAVLPLTQHLFRDFADRGWIFSKTLGLFLLSWLLWTCNVAHAVKFSRAGVVLILVLLAGLSYRGAYYFQKEAGTGASSGSGAGYALVHIDRRLVTLCVIEELLFFGLFALAVYVIGFKPEAYGTEKFMDYAFLTSLARSDYMPFADPWYGGEPINYYYGGQYVAGVLMRFTGTTAGESYNLMRGLVTAMSFMLPFSLVRQLTEDRMRDVRRVDQSASLKPVRGRTSESRIKSRGAARGSAEEPAEGEIHPGNRGITEESAEGEVYSGNRGITEKTADRERSFAAWCSAALAGIAAAFCGNFHYVIYGVVKPFLAARSGETLSYWFPSSTRFIGYDPDIPDKTIHEFPAYSSVLGDLHAHYVNILFVVTVTALVYAWAQSYVRMKNANAAAGVGTFGRGSRKASRGRKGTAKGRAENAANAVPNTAPNAVPDAGVSGLFRKVRSYVGSDVMKADLRIVFSPYVILCGLMTGVFRWLNFWDFPIYYVVCGSIFFFVLLGDYRRKIGRFIFVMIGIAIWMFAAGWAAALPFTMSFDQISSEIGRTWSHTSFYQLAVLWGLPALCLIGYVCALIADQKKSKPKTARHMSLPDLAVLMFALCAAGLVFLPEVIYVKDIYAETHYRANTMFKLTYQAFILFAMCMPYILVRGVLPAEAKLPENVPDEKAVPVRNEKAGPVPVGEVTQICGAGRTAEAERTAEEEQTAKAEQTSEEQSEGRRERRRGSISRNIFRLFSAVGILCLFLTGGYIFKSIESWFGDVTNPAERINTDASVFISESFPSDFEAVNWLNTNVGGQPVIVEATGDSYSDYERISVATGLPTVIGWRVHEWLWRSDLTSVDQRIADVERIYTSPDSQEVQELLDRYGVSYIYVGSLEYEKYPELQEGLLRDLGETVYDDGETWIVHYEAA